ncbi:MAG: extracellular solute-binding protein [Desulfosarcinaceae bacterium]|nr:extracellular solute-binding protein [Desulfosarcinaceae bacterium]
MRKRLLWTAAALLLMLSPLCPDSTEADCQITAAGEVNVISSQFPVLEVLSKAMRSCEGKGLTITYDFLPRKHSEADAALALAFSESTIYDLIQVANGSIAVPQATGQLMPLNDLVDKYRDRYAIEEATLIRFGGDIMAVAFQVNAQHLFYRKDLLAKYDIPVPTTYAEVLAAAETLKAKGAIAFPLGGTFMRGWNIALEFINIYLAMGGELFQAGSAEAAFDGDKGVQTLELMRQLLAYMPPNALLADTTMVMQQFQQGQIAMANLWASRAAKMDDRTESTVVGQIEFAAAPAATPGGPPATTLWWDGYVLPKTMDGDPDLAFQVMMEGLKAEVVEKHNDAALWLRSVYKPGPFAKGVVACVQAGAPSYPIQAQATLAHTALGNHIEGYLRGTDTARAVLTDAKAEYTKLAKENGYLN